MRALMLLIAVIMAGATTVAYPFVGLLTWEWLTLMSPHKIVWGAGGIPYNEIIAFVAIGAWLLSKEPKRPPGSALTWALMTFAILLMISQIFSLDSVYSKVFFDRFIRVLIFIFLCLILINSKLRIHAALWVMVLSLGFYGAKAGVFTLLSGGANHAFGPPQTVIADNNQLGLALTVTLPFMLYLYRQTQNKAVRSVLIITAGLTGLAILGTQSRGAFLALAVIGGFIWWRSHKKILSLIVLLLFGGSALALMPVSWTDRMLSIQDFESDSSFQGRVDAWEINWNIAKANPLTGAGLRNPYQQTIANQYINEPLKARAAHSIYFEIIGGMGLLAFINFMIILLIPLKQSIVMRRRLRTMKRSSWMHDLATTSQISLAAFMVGGAAVSMEMWEGYLLVAVITGALYKLQEAQYPETEEEKFER